MRSGGINRSETCGSVQGSGGGTRVARVRSPFDNYTFGNWEKWETKSLATFPFSGVPCVSGESPTVPATSFVRPDANGWPPLRRQRVPTLLARRRNGKKRTLSRRWFRGARFVPDADTVDMLCYVSISFRLGPGRLFVITRTDFGNENFPRFSWGNFSVLCHVKEGRLVCSFTTLNEPPLQLLSFRRKKKAFLLSGTVKILFFTRFPFESASAERIRIT